MPSDILRREAKKYLGMLDIKLALVSKVLAYNEEEEKRHYRIFIPYYRLVLKEIPADGEEYTISNDPKITIKRFNENVKIEIWKKEKLAEREYVLEVTFKGNGDLESISLFSKDYNYSNNPEERKTYLIKEKQFS